MSLSGCGNSPPSLPNDATSQGPRLHFLKSSRGAGYFLLENVSNRRIKFSGNKIDGTVFVTYGADYQCQYKDDSNQWFGMNEIRDYLSQSEFDVAPGSEQQIAYYYPSKTVSRDPSEQSEDNHLRHDRCKLVLKAEGGIGVTSPIFSMDGEDVVVWKSELLSPDKKWFARAEAIQIGDFDSSNIDTNVYLDSTEEKESRFKVLTLISTGSVPHPYELNEANRGGTINLSLKWLTPSQLEISYQGHAQERNRAVGVDQIQIKVRALSSADAK